jgi:hypothetical protein
MKTNEELRKEIRKIMRSNEKNELMLKKLGKELYIRTFPSKPIPPWKCMLRELGIVI